MYYSKKILLLGIFALFVAACTSTAPDDSPGLAGNIQTVKENSVESEYQQAIQLMRKGSTDHAIKVLERITLAHPKLSGPFANLGILYQKKDRLDDAEKALRRAIGLNAGNAVTYNQLGIVYRKSPKLQESRQYYERAIIIDPGYSIAYLNLGILYDLYLVDINQALVNYQQYQKLSNTKDQKVSQWIQDLQRRIKNTDEKLSKNP